MAKNIRALVVAGGGNAANSGAGGAGGFQDVPALAVDIKDYAVTVGDAQQDSSFGDLLVSQAGGDGGADNGSSTNAGNGEGGGSGGGGGGKGNGSGGPGSGGPGIVGQGHHGTGGKEGKSSGSCRHAAGGGGGGAGGDATPVSCDDGGDGGVGLTSDIIQAGVFVEYAHGGGGDGDGPGSGGGSQPNTGNGGTHDGNGLTGATGIVVIRYITSQFGKCTGGTITTDGLYTVHTFTASGIFSITDVTTNLVTAIGFTDATGNGEVAVAIGVTVTERGFAWGLAADPTIAGSKVTVAGTSGAYTGAITGLNANTLYHVRAYITDSLGNTTYGADVTFTTASIANNKLYKNLGAEDGDIFAVRFTIGGTVGSVDVQLGSTSTPQNVLAGAGVVTLTGTYSGDNGLIFAASATFDGWIDDVMFVQLLNVDQLVLINWAASALVTPIAINSSVVFKRIEDSEFNRFRIYRYLDSLFKDVDGYVTATVRKEANDGVVVKTGTFLVGNLASDASPFVKKKISFLAKVQAILIGYSNANLNDQLIITKFQLSGSEEPKKMFDGGRIISID